MDTDDDDLYHQNEQPFSETEVEKTDVDETEAERTDAEKTDAEETETEADETDAEKTDSEKTDSEKTEAEENEAERTDAEKTNAEKTDAEETGADVTEAEENEANETDAEETNTSETANSELKAITSANGITDERDQLLIISSLKDGTIKRLRLELKMLEVQLTSAVSAKSDALARLDSIEGKEQSLEYKEKRMEREKNLLNSQIAYLTDSLNSTMSKLLAVRTESTTAAIQMKDELKRKTEELRVANASICQLIQANRLLKTQSKENVVKLNEQVNQSVDLINKYQNQLDAKTQLAELYKMDSDDDKAQIDKLTAALKEMKGMLNESVDECGAFETKLRGIEKKHQIELNAKTEVIEKLKRELEIANELLKTKEGENTETDLCPSNVIANCRLNSGMTLTEICSRFYSVQEELHSKERECDALKLDTESIIAELQAKAPEFENLRVKYRQTVAVNEELTQKIDDYIAEKIVIREDLQNARSKFEYLEQENEKLKSGQNDLAKQVRNLLNVIDAPTPRVGEMAVQNRLISSDMQANEVISETLVTFNNIEELQENNQKLLLLVRDLSTKLEEMEITLKSINVESYKAKITGYEREVDNLQCQLSKRTAETMRFERLYHEIMEDFCKEPSATNSLTSERKNQVDLSVNADQIASNCAKDENVLDMEKMEKLEDVIEEHIEYHPKKSKKKMLKEDMNTLRNEVLTLTETNLEMSRQADYSTELIKTLRNNISINKRKIETLEDSNQRHKKTIDKYKISSKYLKAELSNTVKKLSAANNRNEHLDRNCCSLMELNKRLEVERQQKIREKLSDSNQQRILEMIKESIERLNNEDRVAQRLDDISREASALSRRLLDEQDHFREEINAIKQEKENAEKKMSDVAETLRAKLIKAEEQIQAKNQELNELSTKIPQSLKPSFFDNFPTDFIQMASVWEGEAIVLKYNFEMTKNELTADLIASKLTEIKLKAQVEELRLRIADTDANVAAGTAFKSNIETEMKEALFKLSEKERELEDWRSKFNTLTMNLETIEHNYSNEMQAHSSDLQTLTICKDELNKSQEQMGQLRVAKDVANKRLETSRLEWEKLKKVVDGFKLEQKLECLCQQNIALCDQHAQHKKVLTTNNDSINDSGNSSILNPTHTEDEVNESSSDKLLTIIKDLGKEKDISIAKVEIYKSENTSLLNKNESLCQSDLNNLKQTNVRLIQELTEMKSTIKKKEHDIAEMERTHSKKIDDLSSQLSSCQDEIEKLRKENETLNEQDVKKLIDDKFAVVEGLSSGGHKRPLDTGNDSSRGVNESSSTEQTQNKRIRLTEHSCQIQVTDSDSVVLTSSPCEIIAGITNVENECSTFDDNASQMNGNINVSINVDAEDYIDIESVDVTKVEEGHDAELRNRRSDRNHCEPMTVGMQRSIPIDLDEGVRGQQSPPRAIRNRSERIRRRLSIQRSISMVLDKVARGQQSPPRAIRNRSERIRRKPTIQQSISMVSDEVARGQQSQPRAIRNRSERIRRKPTIQRSISMVSDEEVRGQQSPPRAIRNRSERIRPRLSMHTIEPSAIRNVVRGSGVVKVEL